MLKSLFGDIHLPSDINNPFSVEHIIGIHIHYGVTFLGTPYFSGNVEFKNGNTKAEQYFKGKNLTDVFIKIRNFCKNLEKNT